MLATSDLPGGVVNVLSGKTAEIAAPLAAHQDVNVIDLAGADDVLAKELEIAAADNLKRVVRPQAVDYSRTPGIERLTAFLETKTVWHPTGAPGASGSSRVAVLHGGPPGPITRPHRLGTPIRVPGVPFTREPRFPSVQGKRGSLLLQYGNPVACPSTRQPSERPWPVRSKVTRSHANTSTERRSGATTVFGGPRTALQLHRSGLKPRPWPCLTKHRPLPGAVPPSSEA